jgi:hypothetical protein
VDVRVSSPLTADSVFRALKEVQRQIELDLRAEKKGEDWFPAWHLHLPSGQKVRIRWFSTEGPLLEFTTPEGDPIYVAPESLVLTLDPLSEGEETFPVEWSDGEEDATS